MVSSPPVGSVYVTVTSCSSRTALASRSATVRPLSVTGEFDDRSADSPSTSAVKSLAAGPFWSSRTSS